MRSFGLAVLLVLMTTPQLAAQSLEKAYFAATDPGTWARYESSWERPDGLAGTNIYTYIRASDSDGRVRIEIDIDTKAGPGAGMVTRQLSVMEPEFDLSGNFLNHTMFVEASVLQAGEGSPSLMQDNVLEIVRESAGDMTNSVAFKGRADRVGRPCDLYAYSYTSGGPNPTLQEGEVCLDETVPFGVVFQQGRVVDSAGTQVSSFEQKLLDSGAGMTGAEELLALTPTAGPTAEAGAAAADLPSLSFAEAYQNGKVRLVVEVVEGTDGRRLDLTAMSTAEEPFELVVPAGPLTITADSPLGELNLVFSESQRLALPPGGSTPSLSAGQPGDRGATAGRFQLIVYEGQPLFQGTVEVGPLK